MATALPTSLKTPELTRLTHRAAQLKQAKPVIWYWSNYHVLNQIVANNLHTTDADSMNYTTKLMDDVEQFKSEHSTNDAVTDEVAGKAYVEQFALETFARADNAVRADKATRQTADTFQAAGTFLDLLASLGTSDPEIAAKSKYAKYHALRIAKAIKAGEDPNLSNPKQQPEGDDSLPPLDPNDAEVQALGGTQMNSRQPSVVDAADESHRLQAQLARTSSLDQSLHPSRDPSAIRQQRQPSAMEIPDEAHRVQTDLARQSSKDESLHPSRAPSLPRPSGEAVSPLAPQDEASFYSSNVPADVSPLEPPPERKPSIGGNYFPVVPQNTSSEHNSLPPTSAMPPSGHPPLGHGQSSSPTGTYIPQTPSAFTSQTQPSIQAPMSPPAPNPYNTNFAPPPVPNQISSPPPPISHGMPQYPQSQYQTYQAQRQQQSQPQLQPPTSPPAFTTPSPAPVQYYQAQQPTYAPPPPANNPPQPVSTSIVVDEEAVLKAQKHARWAISALNFEDVQTAIRELEGALRVLGAR